ncbi:hypothetical protein H6P81_005732 [Aristolochia fimbriata]|uniref:Receptor-like serine/threonine-protein kinase n=1 Tax=Aristolochia fimbriata TaxID=158543 RepID=A0AAV7EVG3_ARIFI|nr:hypothetical protein H6P81_005732 [Aristolochia fimbriata]
MAMFSLKIRVHIAVLIARLLFYVFCFPPCQALDNITRNRALKDGESIVSIGGKYVLGFFSPNRSSNRYVGIWYSSDSEQPVPVVWVANRENPITDSSGVVYVNENGSLVIADGRQNRLWSSSTSITARNTSATLLDTGNLVVLDPNTGETIWESFDHPSHGLLPTMKIGIDLNTSQSRFLQSWKDASDPSAGNFSLGISPLKPPYQAYIWRNISEPYWRSGPWNGRAFLGIPGMSSRFISEFSVDEEGGSVTMMFDPYNDSASNQTLFRLNSSGNFEQLLWIDEKKEWLSTWSALRNECDVYGKCGPSGVCNPLSSPLCTCIRGYGPRFKEEWNRGKWSGGCVRRNLLKCELEANGSSNSSSREDAFLKLQMMKVPDTIASLSFVSADDCEGMCLRNCSCSGYAFDAGIGCMFWNGDMIDLQIFGVDGVDLYVRLPASELGRKNQIEKVIVIVVVLGTSIICVFLFLMWRWLVKRRERGYHDEAESNGEGRLIQNYSAQQSNGRNSLQIRLKQEDGSELPMFDFKVVSLATDDFSSANKLGGGGFGTVYKGKLPSGQEVAVKRLSKASVQGLHEFRNEVIVISRVQHKNLVRLLGYCAEGEEKMLLYEFMPNRSLDAFIFGSDGRKLDWAQRFHVIEGVARGLLYLHRDSRLKIIHRDLKASNILLDKELNPKISDFGLARIFGGSEIEANTRRVVGTYGYMSPEYAMEGLFSEKSDVFSFGVLLLEIVSGKKNTSFYNQEQSQSLNLLSHAWKLWNHGQALELIDPKLGSTYAEPQVLRCIHVGLLCVQEFAVDRPSTSAMALLLGTDNAMPPTPKQPAFTITAWRHSTTASEERASINNVTVTTLEGR